MTQSDEAPRAGKPPDMNSEERLRAELLTSGLEDWVPLAEVETVINRANLADSLTALQDLALRTIRSLLADGLMRIGDLPHPGEDFAGWDVSIDAAMQRVYDLFVGHYHERALWDLTIWLGLTPDGEKLARTLYSHPT
ncbi:hypothetical protein DSM43518_03605 [Mycobacterium marinum]|uniref:hypothetical protein n=3 Tax=Mycobacterium marinum TaxID=1781 RepID=UPI000358CE53|nr:hypothetical protein [Mycobacterium marinum]EPQ75195.1 hypothetical protein MMEU_2855 [Mycobacterium marinum str. Europe]AXN45400.1 hypothetical protein MM1218R_03466 [Mycobacterium marinum]AXN50696.1 hypothetical protein CCUG20998_03293 [Mycobacterium marinum]RFZ07137.1 hypothetical protein DSM43518_03605 [Mycobacterium marinum]RFZ30099.1 hypothetical protein DSM44344_00537 [Mycobacterium marinum]